MRKHRTGNIGPAILLAQVHGAVWAVSTLDGNGNPSVGSAFAVVSTSAQTLLLTSFGVVAAATYQTPPPVQVRQGNGADQSVTLRSWDSVHDLALLVMDKGNQPVLHGTSGVPPTLGQQVFQVSGAGGPTGAVTAGKLTSVSAGTLEEDTPPDTTSRGGPLIDANGDVLGVVASSTYLRRSRPPVLTPTPWCRSRTHAAGCWSAPGAPFPRPSPGRRHGPRRLTALPGSPRWRHVPRRARWSGRTWRNARRVPRPVRAGRRR